MQKKLLAVAVAGALALPGAALAASSVTITGFFKVHFGNVKVSGKPGRDSETRLHDDSSRIYFRVVEDLGGGLQAIGQVDWRVGIDTGADAVSGANWVGLRSKQWGSLKLGRHDLHYVYTEDQTYSRGGPLKATNIGILGFMGGGGVAIAGNTRTTNAIVWDSPNWKGFTVRVAHSTNPTAVEADVAAIAVRKGSAWNVAPQYNAKNWGIGYSYWKAKDDGLVGAFNNRRGDRVNGHYQWGGLRVGAVWDRGKAKNDATGAQTSKRDAYSIPVRYDWGKHSVFGQYSWAADDKSIPNTAGDQRAKMYGIGYSYGFSKRTRVSLSYSKIRNNAGAAYNLFTNTGGLGTPGAAITAPGQDPSQLTVGLRHSF